MLGEASENIARIQKVQKFNESLNTRFEDDFEDFRSEAYQIPKEEGEWEIFTSNRASTEAYKVINALANADIKISIPISDEDKKKRKNLSKTEQFVYGAIALRDNLITGIPEALPLQASMSWHAPIRGWLGLLVYLYEEDGKIIPHIAVWDILNTRWISGSKGLLWTANERYASPEDVKESYNVDLPPDKQGRVILHDVWDKDEHGVLGGGISTNSGGFEGDWVLKPEEHGLKHVPVLILPGGSTPYIQSGRFEDTIKNVGESWAVNNRHLYNTENRMGSYLLTMTGRAAKTPMAHEWDSSKGGVFPALSGNPFAKGSEIPIDVGKGEKIVPLTPPEMTRDSYAFFDYLRSILDLGGQSPLPPSAGPASGLNIKRHEAMEKTNVARRLMERAYEWLAHELVSQYANGKFKKMEIQGIDGSNRKFKMEVEPKDIDSSWQFKAEIISSFPQDDMANVGMATQLKAARLLSDESIRDQYLHVADTDIEQQKIDRQQAYEMHFINDRHLAAVLADLGDETGARFILEDIERMKMERGREPGIASQPGITSPVRPSADTSAVTPTPARDSKLQNFLSRLGGR